jgi:benzylsuccinate CoA-transferase BbsF subunit
VSTPYQQSATLPRRNGPLAGVRVVDFGWVVAGSAATKYLAHFGAEVIKLESAKRLDSARMIWPWAGGKTGVNRSGYFSTHNASKLSLQMNTGVPEGRELVRRLVLAADAVCENFSPGLLDRLGLGYRDLAALRPDIIMVSSSGLGQTGPYANHPALGYLVQAYAGLNHLSGWPDREPLGPNEPYSDLVAPWFALLALLSALDHRDRTGRGQYVDVSQVEATIHCLTPALLDWTVNGRNPGRNGNRHPSAAPHGVYPCAESASQTSYLAIACYDDAQWHAFQATTTLPALAEPRFATLLGRKEHEDALDALVAGWTAGREAEATAAQLQAAGVPASIVARGEDFFRDPQLTARGHFVELNHVEMGPHPNEQPSFQLSRTPARQNAAPCMGEHNGYVLRKLLDLDEGEIRRLQEAGALA